MLCMKVLIAQLFLTLCNPTDCSPPGSSVLEILQARILEWIAIPFSRGSSQPRDQIWVFLHCRQILYHLNNQGSPLEPKFTANYIPLTLIMLSLWGLLSFSHLVGY